MDAIAKRRREICEHYVQSRSLTTTGRAFGISRQRVHQIVHEERKRQDGEDHARGSDTAQATGADILG